MRTTIGITDSRQTTGSPVEDRSDAGRIAAVYDRSAWASGSRRLAAVLLGAALGLCAIQPAGADGIASTSGTLSGEQAFSACASCHSLADGAAHKVGPNLFGVVGRPAASADDYRYSPALSSSGLIWTQETLFAWIGDSEALVPGSWMLYHNLLSGEEVIELIDYLERAGE